MPVSAIVSGASGMHMHEIISRPNTEDSALLLCAVITIIARIREGSGMITITLNEWIHPWHHPHRTKATRQSEAGNEHRPKQETLASAVALSCIEKKTFISEIYIGWASREQSVISAVDLGRSSDGQYSRCRLGRKGI